MVIDLKKKRNIVKLTKSSLVDNAWQLGFAKTVSICRLQNFAPISVTERSLAMSQHAEPVPAGVTLYSYD